MKPRLLAIVVLLGAVLVPVTGRGGEPDDRGRIDFRTRILPVLTHRGCNAGACHGAATGQGGFRLSLLGYDPEADHFSITRELGARRIDRVDPASSLLLLKASGRVDHEGGRRIRRDTPEYRLLERWVAAGAPSGPPDLKVTSIDVQPAWVGGGGATGPTPLRVRARLSDGTIEDVTEWALYSSNDDTVARVERDGTVSTVGPGSTAVVVRYAGQVAAVRVEQAYGRGPISPAEAIQPTPDGPIDGPIFARLLRMGLPASPPADDPMFLRRVTLDLAGRLPTAEEVAELPEATGDAAWRDRVIDRLLASDEAADLWTFRWAELLRISGRRGSESAATAFQGWLRGQVAANRPWDETVRAVLMAGGAPATNGPAAFFLSRSDPRDLAEAAAERFLGLRIGCARCHAHPADRWTREDHHRFAAFFARVRQDGDRIVDSGAGEVGHPKTGEPLVPAPLGESAMDSDDGASRRTRVADWITSAGNPWFARAVANRVWRHLLGRGLVEPVDDLRPTNPPTHPEVLDALAARLTATGFDLRDLIRTIARSRVYQLSSVPMPANAADDRLHSHARVKAPSAEVFLDMVAAATGIPEVFPDQADAVRAVQRVATGVSVPALEVLGQCPREDPCESVPTGGGGLAMALHLINGATINDRLAPAVANLRNRIGNDPGDLVRAMYVRTLSRLPNPAEQDAWLAEIRRRPESEALEDLFWALLSSHEFGFIR